ncbi:MAG: TSCPD domain-containing protein [Rhizomicrobium sp.]
MTERRRLPNRRASMTFDIEANGMPFTVTISRFSDGALAEIFVTNHKNGSHADINARDAAVTASIALQYGAPVDVLRKALIRDGRGVASGPLSTALDLIAEMDKGQAR